MTVVIAGGDANLTTVLLLLTDLFAKESVPSHTVDEAFWPLAS